MRALFGTATALCVALCGCATMNPYISHDREPSNTAVNSCELEGDGDVAMDYACKMTVRVEKARAEIVSTRSGLTATLFPIAAIIGYNSARGINAATSAALAAGGFAGYSAVTTLAQVDRIRVYDNGLRSMSCAIGEYQAAKVAAPPEAANRQVAKVLLRNLRAKVESERERAKSKVRANDPRILDLDKLLGVIDGFENWLADGDPSRTISFQLVAFIRSVVADVNSQLTLTVPDNRQIAGDTLASFQARTPLKNDFRASSAYDSLLKAKFDKSDGADELIEFNKGTGVAIQQIIPLLESIENDATAVTARLNLEKCEYKDLSDVGVKGAIGRLMIGPGDQYSGKTIPIARDTDFKVTLSGGVPPYQAAATVIEGTDQVLTTLSDGITLTIRVNTVKGAGKGSYQIIVSDATNSVAKEFIVTVSAAP